MLCDFGWLSYFDPAQWEIDRNAFKWGRKAFPLDSKIQIALRGIEESTSLQNRLAFLEQLVVTDFIAIDQIALERDFIQLPRGLESCFRPFRPSEATYRLAENQVRKVKNEFRNTPYMLGDIFNLTNRLSEDPFWSHTEKRYHDLLVRESTVSRFTCPSLADSNDSLGRALFYLEFSQELDITPNLSPDKKHWLNEFQRIVEPPLHDRISKLFDKAVTEELDTILHNAAGVSQIATPPVAELIVRTCLAQNRPLDEVTMELKESREAKSYREMLATIEGNLKRGRAGQIEAARAIRSLSDLASVWSEELDPTLGVFKRKRTLSFKSLPLIGKLLETANMSELEIKDYILSSPPGYLAFISSWYTR